jgi:DNA invertase Pin-like site-specific DNA recombinase
VDYDTFLERQITEERQYILAKGRDANSVRLLASILNISNSTLQRKLKELGIVFKTKNKKGELNYES